MVSVVQWLEQPSVEPEVPGSILTGGSVPSGWNLLSTDICKGLILPDHTLLPTQEINLGTLECPVSE